MPLAVSVLPVPALRLLNTSLNAVVVSPVASVPLVIAGAPTEVAVPS